MATEALRQVDFSAGRKESVIRVLESVLERARAGSFMSVTVLLEEPDGIVIDYSGSDNLLDLLGKVSRVQHSIQKRMDGE
jgi:hypothetical protein